MKSNRMFGILSILLDRKQVTAKELAEYFEVSVRTIHRDLLDLSSAGFPITTQQGIGGGISLMPNFKYNKSVLNKDDMDIILAGIQGLSSIDDSAKIKTLLAKLRFSNSNKMLLENDIVIDFSSWNHNSTIIDKIRRIRVAIANHKLLNLKYYSSNGYRERIVEPYKLLFKQESWYLLAYCHYRNDFRIFKVERITDLQITKETFEEREDYETPLLKSDFSNSQGIGITVRMDKFLEFLALDFFGEENIKKTTDNLYITFHSEYPSWVITTFASLGEKAEIISPDSLRTELKDFLKNALSQYEI